MFKGFKSYARAKKALNRSKKNLARQTDRKKSCKAKGRKNIYKKVIQHKEDRKTNPAKRTLSTPWLLTSLMVYPSCGENKNKRTVEWPWSQRLSFPLSLICLQLLLLYFFSTYIKLRGKKENHLVHGTVKCVNVDLTIVHFARASVFFIAFLSCSGYPRMLYFSIKHVRASFIHSIKAQMNKYYYLALLLFFLYYK